MQFSHSSAGNSREGSEMGINLNVDMAKQRSTTTTTTATTSAHNDNKWNYEEVLEEIGFGKTQWILLLISGLITITSMAAQTSIGIIAIASQCEFDTSQGEKGVMMAACVTGIVLATYIGGYISDAIGRRSILVWCSFATAGLQLITMFVTNVWLFNVINLIMGISLGGVSGALYAYLGEFNTPKYRAVVINYSTMFVSIAAIYMPATCWLVLSADWSLPITDSFTFKPWRLIILFNLLPGLIGTLMLLPFPESPKYLLAQRQHNEAFEAVNWIAKFNRHKDVFTLLKVNELKLTSDELTDTMKLFTDNQKCSMFLNIWKATKPMFHRPYGINFCLAIVAMFGLFFSSNGMQVWYPEIVNRSAGGSTTGSDVAVCQILHESFQHDSNVTSNSTILLTDKNNNCNDFISTKTYIDNMIMGLAFLIGFSIQGVLLNPLGRKNILMALLGTAVLSGILLHFITNPTGILVLFCLYILLPGLSISIMCGAMVDLLPTQLRGKAVSMGMTLGRLGVIVASNLIAVMLEPYCDGIFAIITCFMLICGVLVYFLPI